MFVRIFLHTPYNCHNFISKTILNFYYFFKLYSHVWKNKFSIKKCKNILKYGLVQFKSIFFFKSICFCSKTQFCHMCHSEYYNKLVKIWTTI